MANGVDPDQMLHYLASETDLGLRCLLRPVCPNKSKYGNMIKWNLYRNPGSGSAFWSVDPKRVICKHC